ncbi:MAG TPA: hypothetical protein VF680_17475 [Allosphingosinicella sp.]|jgi:hypothetical protein
MKTPTLEEFRAAWREVADIGAVHPQIAEFTDGEPLAGWVYDLPPEWDSVPLFIYRHPRPEAGEAVATIYNHEAVGPLADMIAVTYEWAVSEGMWQFDNKAGA